MHRKHIEAQVLAGCRRLVDKGFLNTASDSFSMRIPRSMEMILVSGCKNWQQIGVADLHTLSFSVNEGCAGLHSTIYQIRADVGAVTITSSRAARLLAHCGGRFPTLFDEQARHLGASPTSLADGETVPVDLLRKALGQGANAVLLGERLLCLGMTCERVLCNTELLEKCVQAYVIASASGHRVGVIPGWVRLIANRRLLRDECRAAESYRQGITPEGIGGY